MVKRRHRDLTVEQQLARGPMDLPYLMLVVLLVGIGVIMVFSASYASAFYEEGDPTHYFIKQALFAGAGLVIMFLASRINYQTFRGLSLLILGGSVLLLIMVKIPGIGVKVNGASRWIQLPMLPRFQPSEVAKLGIVLYFAARLSKRDSEKKKNWNSKSVAGRTLATLDKIGFLELVPYGGILLLVVGLMLLQPHMSGIILISAGAAAVLFAGGIKLGWFAAGGAILGGGLYVVMNHTSYMAARIAMWKDPWADGLNGLGQGYQTIQSLYAIGSGGLLGKGLGNSVQKFLYLPEEHNDFIFAIVCEELGLIGALLILSLFALLVIRGYWLAIHTRDRFGALIIVGFNTLLAVQVFLNIGVVTNLFPVTGISLPFFSYGGTALLIQMLEMGIVLGVSRQIQAPKQG